MTAFGDPQKQNIARGALVGAFVGVCIMGISFLAPRIMSQFVLEPAGLEGVANSGNTGCDRTLRSALITQRGVGNSQQVNSMVRAIQAQRSSDCNQETWNPYAYIKGTPPGTTTALGNSGFGPDCSNATVVAVAKQSVTLILPRPWLTWQRPGKTVLPTVVSLGTPAEIFWSSSRLGIGLLTVQYVGCTLLSPTTGTRRAKACLHSGSAKGNFVTHRDWTIMYEPVLRW